MEIDEKIAKGQIKAKIVIEMMGAPKEHIENTLKKYIEKLKSSEIMEITDDKFFEAEPQGKFFSTFTELDIWFQDITAMSNFCFEAMPSSVEILEPLNLKFKAKPIQDLFNDILGKLHDLDLLVKQVRAEKKLVDTNAVAIFDNFILHIIKEEPKSIADIGSIIGLTAEHLKPFLNKLKEKEKIKEENGKFSKNE